MSTGIWLFCVICVLPLVVFFYAVFLEILKDFVRPFRKGASPDNADTIRSAQDYCYGGLSYTRVIVSTVGTVLAVGTVFQATLNSLFIGGSIPFVGWVVGAVIVYPIIFYSLIRSKSVREYFTNEKLQVGEQSRGFRSLLGFLASDYGIWGRKYFYSIILINLSCLIIVEIAFTVVWTNRLLAPRFDYAAFVPAFLVFVCFVYVYVGGYPAVLRTDSIQFTVIFTIFLIIIAEVFAFKGLDSTFWQGLFEESKAYPSPKELAVATGNKSIADGNVWELYVSYFMLAFTAFSVMGVWFLAAPDLWNRLGQSIYVKGIFGRDDREQKRKIIYFLVCVAILTGLADLPTGYLGSYGFAHKVELGLNPSEPLMAQYVVADHFVRGEAFGNLNKVSILGTNSLGDFVLIVTLGWITLFALTTIDTALVAIAQTWCDYQIVISKGEKSAKNHPSVFAVRSRLLIFFLPAATVVFMGYRMGGEMGAQYVGLLSAVLGLGLGSSIFFMIIVRVLEWEWLITNGRAACMLHFSAVFATAAISIFLWITKFPIPLLGFGNRAALNIGKVFLIEIIVFTLMFFGGKALTRYLCKAK